MKKGNFVTTNDVNDLLFDVEKTEFTEFAANSDYSHQIIGYPNNEKTLLNACSERYELVKNEDIFLPVVQELEKHGIKFSQEYKIYNNARFFGNYQIKQNEVRIGGSNDVIFPQISVNHSYNGLTKYNILFGWFRLICSNGLTVPVEETKEFNLSINGRHTAKLKESLKELFEKLEYFVNNGNLITQSYKNLADRWVEKWEDRVIEVLNANKITVIDNKSFSTLNSIKDTIVTESNKLYNSNKVNDWLIYNGINQYIFKNDRNNAVPDIKQQQDQKVLNWIVKHNPEKKKVVAVSN